MSSNKTTESHFLWDRSGTDDDGVGELAGALTKLRAPEPRIRLRRWWVAPAVLGVIASLLLFNLVLNQRIPVQIVGLVSGQTGATPLMIKGGSRVELEVIAKNPSAETTQRLVERLADIGFDAVFQSETSIVATHLNHDESTFDGQNPVARLHWELRAEGLTNPLQMLELADTSLEEFASLRDEVTDAGGTVKDGLIVFTDDTAHEHVSEVFATLRSRGFDIAPYSPTTAFVRKSAGLIGPFDVHDAIRRSDSESELALSDEARNRLAQLADDARIALVSERADKTEELSLIGLATYGADKTTRGIRVHIAADDRWKFTYTSYLDTIRREAALVTLNSATPIRSTIFSYDHLACENAFRVAWRLARVRAGCRYRPPGPFARSVGGPSPRWQTEKAARAGVRADDASPRLCFPVSGQSLRTAWYDDARG